MQIVKLKLFFALKKLTHKKLMLCLARIWKSLWSIGAGIIHWLADFEVQSRFGESKDRPEKAVESASEFGLDQASVRATFKRNASVIQNWVQ